MLNKDDGLLVPRSPEEALTIAVSQATLLPTDWVVHPANPVTASNVLVSWVHLMRFPCTVETTTVASRINECVERDADKLVEAALNAGTPLEGFEAQAKALDDAWGTYEAADDGAHGRKILGHFVAFDRERLLVQAVSFLLGMNPGDWHQTFCQREDRVREVERFILANPHLFMTVADYAHMMLNAYRTDLGTPDAGDCADAPLVEVMNHLVVFWRIKTAPHFCAGNRATVFLRPSERAALRALMERRKSS